MNKFIGLNLAQVKQSRKKYGENVVPESAPKSLLSFFLDTYRNKMNMILVMMLVVFFVLWLIGYGDATELIGIGAVLLVIGIIGAITKNRAQKYTMDLKRRIATRFYSVVRSGTVSRVDSREIVVGDIVVLQTGEIIPADGYIISGAIGVNNSVLNGENREVPKRPIKNFKYKYHRPTASDFVGKNLLFAGTTVQSGECQMYVTRVGVNTENARTLIAVRDIVAPKTDLDIKLDNLANKISRFGFLCAVLIAIFMFINNVHGAGGVAEYFELGWQTVLPQILHIITIALTIVVAAVPEGLPFIITIIIAQNARRMIRKNVLAKNTHKIPEAGNINILCTDKTGTLTYGNMVPVGCYLGDGTQVAFEMESPAGIQTFNNIILNNGARFDAAGRMLGGTTTQRALLSLMSDNRDAYARVVSAHTVVVKMPFQSDNKYSSACVVANDTERTYFTGAPEIVLRYVAKYIDSHGKTHALDKDLMSQLLRKNARQAKRMLALAYCDGNYVRLGDRKNLVLSALVSIRDEVRREVPAAVQSMYNAGVQVIMITGDNVDTAHAIAVDTGIVRNPDDMVLTASELDKMSDGEIKKNLGRIRVIARAVPETKLRIVKLAQELNLSIGMCGDGTNDAPAVKRADVGFVMGSGTDVAKEAGDIIITDDNFVSIVDAVLFGRTFMKNIKKFLLFQLPINFTLVLICLAFPLILGGEALSAVHILLINIVVDSLNSLAFSSEPTHAEYMREPAPRKGAPLLDSATRARLVFTVVMFCGFFAITMTSWFWGVFDSMADKNMSARFALLLLLAVVNGFCVRTDDTRLVRGIGKNPMFMIIAGVIVVGTVLFTQFGGHIFGGAHLDLGQWALLVVMALCVVPIDNIRKRVLASFR